VQDENAVLVISYLGYEEKEIKVKSLTGSDVKIKLVPSIQRLQEVVVTGYTTQLKKEITGSVVSISSDALSGKAAGVFVGGSPGANSNIRIRGARTISGDYKPKEDADGEEDEPDDWRYNNNFNTEGYDHITENPFLKVNDNPLSTFSIDVDAASYSNMRRFINDGQLPPAGAIRIEELINYFSYDYSQPKGDDPFSANMEYATCPWNNDHELVLGGFAGKEDTNRKFACI
jgi:Ca-activated chloride channel family protein